MFCQKITANQNGHATGDFAHGLEQGSSAIEFDGFVGQGGDAGFHERFGKLPVGGQMEVGK